MPCSREIPRQQIGEPALQSTGTTQTGTSEESEHMAAGPGLKTWY